MKMPSISGLFDGFYYMVNNAVYSFFITILFKLLIMENYKHSRVEKQNNTPLCTHYPPSTVILQGSC